MGKISNVRKRIKEGIYKDLSGVPPYIFALLGPLVEHAAYGATKAAMEEMKKNQ